MDPIIVVVVLVVLVLLTPCFIVGIIGNKEK